MRQPLQPTRALLLGVLLVVLAVSGSAWAATDSQTAVRFTSAPKRVLQGHAAKITVSVRPVGVSCSLTVRYHNGAMQGGLRAVSAFGGRATWSWQVPDKAATGAATATVSCRNAGRASRAIVVVGDAIPVALKVVKQGFSIRPNPGRGNQVSYGVLIANQSPSFDAKEITVLVNFVAPGDVLIGSATSRVSAIAAGSTYGIGGLLAFPASAPIERLEVVLQVGDRSPRSLRLPGVANVRVLPSLTEPSWIGSVEGELVNDTTFILKSARLSVVVLDAAENIVGGGTGSAIASLPIGARQFFKVTSGLRPIPTGRAASALISIEPTYS
jgi:hypothetical protein